MGSHASEPPSPAASDDARQVLDAIRTVVQALRESARAAEHRAGVSGAQLFVLQVLAKESPLAVGEVAARTHTHSSSVSVVVQRLVERGLVLRRRSAADARRWELAPTDAGRAVVETAPELAQERLIAALSAMPAKKRRALADGLAALITGAGLRKPEPPMFFEDDNAS